MPSAKVTDESQPATVVSDSIVPLGARNDPPSDPTVAPAKPPDADVTKNASTPTAEQSALWLRRSDQLFVGVLVTALVVLLGIQWGRLSDWGTVPIEVTSQRPREYYYSLDINTASWVEWAQLEGIGEKLARRIVEDRKEKGPFRTPNDVRRVRGIGPKLLEKMIPFLHGGTESRQQTQDVTQ